MMNIENDAIADITVDTRSNDPGRHQIELVHLVADDQRMAGIVSSLEAYDATGMVR